jgi:hypothetical protein
LPNGSKVQLGWHIAGIENASNTKKINNGFLVLFSMNQKVE